MSKIFQITVIEPLETKYFIIADEKPNIDCIEISPSIIPFESKGKFISSIDEIEGGEVFLQKGVKNG